MDILNWVYSYCKICWINQIKSILPSLGIFNNDPIISNENNLLKSNKIELENNLQNLKNEINNAINENNTLKSNKIDQENTIKNLNKQINDLDIKITENTNIYKLLLIDNENFKKKLNENEKKNNILIEETDKISTKLFEKEKEYKEIIEENENLKTQIIKNESEKNLANTNINNQSNNNIFIVKYFLNGTKIDEILNLVRSTKIKEFSDVLESINIDNISSELEQKFSFISKNISKQFLDRIKEKIDYLLKEINKKKIEVEENNIKIKNILIEIEMPNDYIDDSLKPLIKYSENLKEKIDSLHFLSENINKI